MKPSLIVALDYLTGLVDTDRVKFQDIENHIEMDWSSLLDKDPHFDPRPEILNALKRLSTAIATSIHRQKDLSITTHDVIIVLTKFGQMVATGEASLASLSILCKCSVSDFEI